MNEDQYNGQPAGNRKRVASAKIKVIGVGGAGNNAVNRMIEAGIMSAEYIVVNTDAQMLALSRAENRIQIGIELTKGLGAGADPEIGKAAAEENEAELAAAIEGTDLLFITTGMGGGTGTGAAPVIARIARERKILTAAVVTKPFEFEGKRRMDNALRGIEELRKYVDTLIIIPNEKISEVVPKNASFPDALRVADEVLKQGIRGIADLIVTPALINLDFADVRTILKDRGMAHMGVGVSKGENRIIEAVRLAVNSPLLDTTIEGATGVILNVVGGNDLTLDEVKTAAKLIHSVVDYGANIIFGACIDPNIRDEVEVTVIATGFPDAEEEPSRSEAQRMQSQRPVPPRPTTPGGYQARPNPDRNPFAQPPRPYYGPRPQGPAYPNPPQGFGPNFNPNPPQPQAQPPQQARPQARPPQQAPMRPVPPVEQTDEPIEPDDNGPDNNTRGGDNLPPFLRRMLGRKKDDK